MAASKQALKFALLDDVQDGAFTVDEDAITIVDSNNKDVKDLFDMYHVLSDEGRTDAINKILEKSGLNPTGEFYLWVAKNPVDYYQGDIAYVSRDRMRYVGYNKFLKNIIYCSIGPDNYLYFKSCNPQHLYLEHVRLTGIFFNSIRASDLQCPDEEGKIPCDILDREFPIEDSLISPLVELTVKELLGASYRPADPDNNAKDDLSDMASFIARNTKSNFQKQLE